MKLVHPDISIQIDFAQNNCYFLYIENSDEFYKLSKELYGQCCNSEEGSFVLSDEEIVDIQKYCVFVYDYYKDMLSDKKISASVNDRILQILKSNDYLEDFARINMILAEVYQKVYDNIDFEIESSAEFTYEHFVKFISCKLYNYEELEQRLISFVDLYLKLTKCKVFIFVNLCLNLSEEKIKSLIKQFKYMQANVLFIESKKIYDLGGVKNITIDNDLCVF